MKFLCVNICASNDSLLKRWFKIYAFKELAYGAVYDDKERKLSFYDNLLIPMKVYDHSQPEHQLAMHRYVKLFRDKFSIDTNVDRTILYSIGSLFEETLPEDVSLEQLCSYGFTIEINKEIDDLEIGIIYSDGSINPNSKVGGFGVVKICENNSEDLIFDNFSNRLRHYEEYSGTVNDSTNNISELNGFKLALQNMDDSKKYWVIISDSDLTIKSFREYLYEWRTNGYKKANSNKSILNCELVKEIDNIVLNSDRVIFYKWIEGHAKKECNERCDILAKTACGVI